MAKFLNRALGFVFLLSICAAGSAQVLPEDRIISIVPRTNPEVAAKAGPSSEFRLRVDASLVLVPAYATSPLGASITNLREDNFRLFEDGVEQKIAYFSRDDAPLSVGLVFDSSGSMSNKIRKSAEAAEAFFKTSNPGDEFFLVGFGDRPKLLMPFTLDSDQIFKKIARSKPFGRTSLIDAIHMALMQMKNAHNDRKALVILSDGGDNRSRLTRREIKGILVESSVQMYAMGIFDPEDVAKHTQEEENGPRLLDELTEQTGGRLYPVDNLDNLASISTTIGNALRNEYVLGYTSSNAARDGKYRRVTVSLTDLPETPAAHVSYRHGYYAPAY